MTESEWIDKVLAAARKGSLVRIRANEPEYEDAIDIAIDRELINSDSLRLTNQGHKAVELGGYDSWIQWVKQRDAQVPGTTNIRDSNVIIGDNNMDNHQGAL